MYDIFSHKGFLGAIIQEGICDDFFPLVHISYFNRNNRHIDNLITAWCTATGIIKFGTAGFECYILGSIWCTRIIIPSFVLWSVTMQASRMLLLRNLAYWSVIVSSCIVWHWNCFQTIITWDANHAFLVTSLHFGTQDVLVLEHKALWAPLLHYLYI